MLFFFFPSLIVVSVFANVYINPHLTFLFAKSFDYIYFCCRREQKSRGCCCCLPCCCGEEPRKEGASTLEIIVRAVNDISGAEVDENVPLSMCGLDSFGASALVGLLKARIANLRLSALEVYSCTTVKDLALLIDDRAKKKMESKMTSDTPIVPLQPTTVC